jgi:hypothetical protein
VEFQKFLQKTEFDKRKFEVWLAKMGILIKKAVLHILDANVGVPVLSQQELELTEETYGFLEKVIAKFFEDENAKAAEFTSESGRMAELCLELTRGLDFIAGSIEIANLLFAIMQANPAIVPADLVCALFSRDDQPYLGILKLNYRTGYIHCVDSEAEVCVNSLIKQKTVLPSETQRLEEAVVVNLVNRSLRLLEKEYEIDGTKDYYLSKTLLRCSQQLSNAQKAKVIDKATQKISKKYYDGDFAPMAQMRKTVAANLDEVNCVELERVAREVFRDDPPAQREYLEEIHQAGLTESQLQLPEKLVTKKFASQKIRTDTGVEINFPSDYFNDRDKLEFINNSDGTISIVIKNVGKISSK